MTRAMTDIRLLVKGSPGYDRPGTVWNASTASRGRSRCVIADDVADAVRYGLSGGYATRRRDLALSPYEQQGGTRDFRYRQGGRPG
jgi:hypothetical protein